MMTPPLSISARPVFKAQAGGRGVAVRVAIGAIERMICHGSLLVSVFRRGWNTRPGWINSLAVPRETRAGCDACWMRAEAGILQGIESCQSDLAAWFRVEQERDAAGSESVK